MSVISKDFLVKNGLVVNTTAKIHSNTNSVSTDSGALTVSGGVGIGGDVWIGGEIIAERLTIQYTTVTTTVVETDDVIQTANTTQSISTDSGALTVAGGVGIGKDLYVGGTIYGTIAGGSISSSVSSATNALNIQVNNVVPQTQYYLALAETKDGSYSALDADTALIYDTTNNLLTVPATSATSIAVNNNVNIGGTLNITGDMGTVTILGYNGVSFLSSDIHNFVGGETVIPQTSGLGLTARTTYYVVAVFSPIRFILGTTPNGSGIGTVGTQKILANTGISPSLQITATTSATSTLTGAMTVAGGVGIGGDLWVGGRIVGGGMRATTSAVPPTNPDPVVGDIWYNSTTDTVYRYTQDGAGNVYWLDITGPSILSHVI